MGEIYIPNYENVHIEALCAAAGQPASVHGFRNTLIQLTGGSPALATDDLWRLYLINRYGTFKGLHIGNYVPERLFNVDTVYNFADANANLIYSLYFSNGTFLSDNLGISLIYYTPVSDIKSATGITFNNITNTTCSNALLYFPSVSSAATTIQVSIENPGTNPSAWIPGVKAPSTILNQNPRPLVAPINVSIPSQSTTALTVDVTAIVQAIMAQSWWTVGSRINFVFYPQELPAEFFTTTLNFNASTPQLYPTLTITS